MLENREFSKPDEAEAVAMPLRRDGDPSSNSRRTTLLAAALIVLAAIAAYSNSFRGEFLFDDEVAVVDNPTIRSLWPIWTVLCPPTGGETVTGRPLLNFTLAINYAVSGLNVWSYHVGNLAIHILASLVLFGILRRTFLLPTMRDRWGPAATTLALVVAMLWTVHPLQTESVTYVVQRAESLMGLWYLLTLYCVIRGHDSTGRNAWYGAASLACLFGMATKEVMASAPLIVLCYDRAFLAGSFREAWRRRYGLYMVLASTWLVLGWGILSGAAVAGIGVGMSWWDYACTQFGAIAGYLRLSVWPHPLVFDYGDHLARGFWEIVPYAAVIVSLGLTTVVACWRWPKTGFLGLCFFAILAPTSSVVPACVTQTIAEHRMYLPLAAVLTGLVIGGFALGPAIRDRGLLSRQQLRIVGMGLSACAIVAMGILTFHRNLDYRNAMSIWQDTIAKRPDHARAHNNLGAVLLARGRVDEAIVHCRKSLELNAGFPDVYNNLGLAMKRRGDLDEAIAYFQKALEIPPDLAIVHNNLSAALMQSGRVEEAIVHYRKALEIQPRLAEVHNSLGTALARCGQMDEAIACFQQVLQLQPNHVEACNNLGNALLRCGRMDEAIFAYQRALTIQADNAAAYNGIGWAMASRGRAREAIPFFQMALKLKSNDAETHHNLGMALATLGNVTEAIVHYDMALKINPDNPNACSSLAWLQSTHPDASVRNGNEAVRLAERAAERSGRQDPNMLDTLAAAYAEAGRFEEAKSTAKQALMLANGQHNAALADVLHARIALYESGQPYREGVAANTNPQPGH